MKSQTVRLIDVLALGPGLIALGLRSHLTENERAFLVVTGALTVIYNLGNWIAAKGDDECDCK